MPRVNSVQMAGGTQTKKSTSNTAGPSVSTELLFIYLITYDSLSKESIILCPQTYLKLHGIMLNYVKHASNTVLKCNAGKVIFRLTGTNSSIWNVYFL